MKNIIRETYLQMGTIFLTMGNTLLSQILVHTVWFRHQMKRLHCFSNVILWQSTEWFNCTNIYVCKIM